MLSGISFRLDPGKTYALVEPMDGEKSTLASLMARLQNPSNGRVLCCSEKTCAA